MQKSLLMSLMAGLWLVLAACGGGSQEQQSQTAAPAPAKPEIPAVAELAIAGNDQMQYDKKKLEVYEGQTVKLTLTHSGTLAKEAMGHNWVLLAQGTDLAAFATSAMGAKDSDYIPADSDAQIIVHTDMLGGGESTSIEFPAPAAGTYKYLCTFPGHYVMMQGDFVVKPRE
ncbi:MAG: azurin [Bacteroidetes bacterium]|nr:MAG: azurin [Bacteroidota bacterium]